MKNASYIMVGTQSLECEFFQAMTGHTNKSRTLFLLESDAEYISEVNKSKIRTTRIRHDTCIRFKRGKNEINIDDLVLTLVDVFYTVVTLSCIRV